MRRRRVRSDPGLFGEEPDVPERFSPAGEFDGVPAFVLDVPETIPKLGYGSHQFFRYYGKFPSVVGREMVRKFAEPGSLVLDCYAGSGTTLVEAQINHNPSYGIDINPLAVLACQVKTRYYDSRALREAFEQTVGSASSADGFWRPDVKPEKLSKWFTEECVRDLGRLRLALDGLESGPARDFLTIAFLGVVRRCSNAYDGEVRPHVNPAKQPRQPMVAFRDKFEDMKVGLEELDRMRPRKVSSNAGIGDSRDPGVYSSMIAPSPSLVVAHPPYLNSFNYLQVFSLEFMWAGEMEQVWRGWSPAVLSALEHRAWPATDSEVRRRYYEDFFSVAKAVSAVMAPHGILAVVVGDATIHKVLEPVHRVIWDQLKESGLIPVEIWYRTTHYGIGKYAYSHRADYHGDAEKRDAIMFFRKPVDS